MAVYRIERGGVPEYHELPDGAQLPEGAVAVDRMPGPFEDWQDGAWVVDDRGLADATAGAEHIAEARALKYAEAMAILSGHDLSHGMLVHEAAVKGMTVTALAEEVRERRVAFIEAEIRRQQRQAGQTGDFTLDD